MKKIIIILLLTISNNVFSDNTIEFKPAIGIVNQFNNQNIVSTGLNIQAGILFNLDLLNIGIFADTSLTTGYPYGFEYHIGGYFDFSINNIGLGIGYYFFGNAFPMISGTGYGSDYYNLHTLRIHTSIINVQFSNIDFKFIPYINMYFNINDNLFNIEEHKMGFGLIISLQPKSKNNYIKTEIIEVEKIVEVVHTVEIEIEKPIYIEIEKEVFIEIEPPQLYDVNGWFLQYDVETGTAQWIHNPDLSKVRF